ncbi:MAG: sigma-54 dependent transcriptional regulator [Salinisphaera sp.]|nr:sigma-54 dependent transcriptional regulator [Salinisphaera sp.]
MNLRVLVVDDRRSARRSLALLLEDNDMAVTEAASGEHALTLLEVASYDVLVTDLRMDGMSGNELLEEAKKRDLRLPIILITAYGSIESAVEAMRMGAYDYLTKPFSEQDMLEKIRQAHSLTTTAPSPSPGPVPVDAGMVADSTAMQGVLLRAGRIAHTELSILITGETGTGKSQLARYLHANSLRAGGPFVTINCASVPEQLLESELFGHRKGSFTGATDDRKGLFEAADAGTIFLDEIDTLPLATQAKFLSVLQDREIRRVGSNRNRPVDVRVISAANRELATLITGGEFRSDLYYRVNGYHIDLPPLRERGQDLARLLEHFIARYAEKYGRGQLVVTPGARELLVNYDYPGNIRELESVAGQVVALADAWGRIDVDSLPDEMFTGGHARAPASPRQPQTASLAETEREIIEAALQCCDTLAETARSLGIGRTTLWRKLRQYNIR